MNHLNKTIIQGNLTRDPEHKDLGSSQLCKFTLASNREYKEKKETCFVDIITWGNLASVCDKYLSKGRHVLVEGRLKLDEWEAKDGTKRNRLTIVANEVVFLPHSCVPGANKKDKEDTDVKEILETRKAIVTDEFKDSELPF